MLDVTVHTPQSNLAQYTINDVDERTDQNPYPKLNPESRKKNPVHETPHAALPFLCIALQLPRIMTIFSLDLPEPVVSVRSQLQLPLLLHLSAPPSQKNQQNQPTTIETNQNNKSTLGPLGRHRFFEHDRLNSKSDSLRYRNKGCSYLVGLCKVSGMGAWMWSLKF